ncbi:Gamma-tubulin complex component 3 [Portunus trituberculatus]|uniref:Gamma-tubulin complex component 3 n=1 Tax=Portunus trituberculatus TaxID=210409 RepID=A0A5B7D8H7_PORTR|nr:Gamma-tubulin complex component 3 [Portunus trituberculatus]
MDSNKDGYRLDPKVRLSPSQKEIILKLSDVGWLYSQVKDFCEWGGTIAGNERTADRTAAGLVNQSLVLALREELNDYCRLIALLEAQIQDGGDTPLGEPSRGLTLRRLVMWTLEPRAQLRALAFLTHAARKVYGGACVSSIYQHLRHGNPGHRAIVCKVLTRACTPVYVMLTQWLLDGALEDPHHEFFIASDPTVADDRLWHDKYSIRETSRHVLEEIMTRHKLMDHLRALRRYLLLGQGDFIHYLMEILNPELDKPATNLYPHNLSSLLETAVVASNAQYEEPDILKRLDVRLLEISPGDLGWDVFSLDYHVDGPIGTDPPKRRCLWRFASWGDLMRINTQTYQDMVQSFLLMLAQHDDQNLHLLSTRLDFNEYYHRRDHRLNQRLTYHHKRKSMGTSFCQ